MFNLSIVFIIILVLFIVALVFYARHKKNLNIGSISLITGGVKSGKTSLGVALSLKEYKKAYRKWFFKSLFNKSYEKPLFYSNIPISIPCDLYHLLKRDYEKINKKRIVPYAQITNDLLDRKKRLAYGSITYLGEFSLIADSMSGSVKGNREQQEEIYELAERLTLFVKLYGHETGGCTIINGKKVKSIGPGKCICDTQALADVHFGLRRNVTSAIFIERSIKCIPFIMLFKVRELIYLDENSINVFDSDIEDNMKWYIILKPWKYFDYCCYSLFTDNLELVNDSKSIGYTDSHKAKVLPSFRKFRSIKLDKNGEVINNE